MSKSSLLIAIYYEHPDWFRPLFAELDRRGTPYLRLDASKTSYDPAEASESRLGLLFNRMSASAYLRGHQDAIFFTRDYLAHLGERLDHLASGLVGTPEQVQRSVAEFEDAGADLLLLQCSPQMEEMEIFAETVIRKGVWAGQRR